MSKEIKIAGEMVGDKHPVYVIAEAGVNHNGNFKTALKLVDAAVGAGADAIKFQTFRAEDVVTDRGKMVGYQVKNIGKTMSQLDMIRGFELSEDCWSLISDYCRKKKITFLSTPHGGFHSIDLLQSLKVPAFKFGSGDLTSLPLLEYAAKFKKPMILGTGMATLAEVREAVNCIRKTGNHSIVVLHCTTNYPCPWEEVNLRAMLTMKEKIKTLIGYSDHTNGIQVPIMAATLGACLIEKHFTLDRDMLGPDHKASLEPKELKEMVDSVKRVEVIMGSKVKRPNLDESLVAKTVRKSIVAADEIKKGDIFTMNNLAIKRPFNGLAPKKWEKLIGRPAKRDYKADDTIDSSEI